MKVILKCITISLIFYSCTTPQEALEKGNYLSAFNLATQQLEKNKEIEKNTVIVIEATRQLVNNELGRNNPLINSPKVRNWVTVQNRYYNLLENIARANQLTGGELTHYYDEVCIAKQDIDYQITAYYYNEGQHYLAIYDETNSKQAAQSAYYEFAKSLKTGGHLYFEYLEDLIIECEALGIVYYTSNIDIDSKFFLRPLPNDADFEADCSIDINTSHINFSEDETLNEEVFNKKIKVGTEEVKDTAGVITYFPIYENVEAVVKTYTITVTASQTTWITVDNLSGQCDLESDSFTTQVSDSYKEIEINGNKDALNHHIQEKSGEPIFFKSGLIDDLEDDVEDEIDDW